MNSAFFGPPTRTLDPHRAVSVLGADMLTRLVDEVELFRTVDGSVNRGEAALITLNDQAAKAALASGADIDARTRTMLSFAGPLAALETPERQDGDGERALGRLLLAYWGLDVDADVLPASSDAELPDQAALQDA